MTLTVDRRQELAELLAIYRARDLHPETEPRDHNFAAWILGRFGDGSYRAPAGYCPHCDHCQHDHPQVEPATAVEPASESRPTLRCRCGDWFTDIGALAAHAWAKHDRWPDQSETRPRRTAA